MVGEVFPFTVTNVMVSYTCGEREGGKDVRELSRMVDGIYFPHANSVRLRLRNNVLLVQFAISFVAWNDKLLLHLIS